MSYIAILLIPALINISVYFKTENIIENEVNEAYSVLLNQLQGVMDQHINNIKKMVVDISVNSNVNSFMYAKKPLYKHNYYSKFHTMTQMPKDMVIYKNANDIIDDFYIYFMYSDIIISPSAVNSPLTMYNYVYKFKGMTFEQWDQVFLQKRYDNSYSLAEVEDTRGNTKNVIVFAHSLPLGYTTNKIANIFIMIDEDKLLQILVNTKLKEAGSAFIIDKDNTVLLSTKPYGDNPVCYEELRSGEGLIYKEIEGQKVVISHISSSVNDWEYVSVVPTAVFREKIVYIKKITYFSMLVYLFIGLVISYLFTRKNYKPLGDLVYTIADTGLNPIKKSNEIQYIKDAVHKTIIMQGEIDKQKNTLRNNFIRSLVLGKFDNQVHIDELLNFYSIDFDLSKPYTISLFYMYEFNKLSGITNNNNELGIYHSLVIDAISKTMEGNYKIYLFEVDDMLGCITSSVEDHHQDDIEKLTALCSAILDFLESNFNLYITVSLSRWHGGYRDLKRVRNSYC